jgi:hypothetical protein
MSNYNYITKSSIAGAAILWQIILVLIIVILAVVVGVQVMEYLYYGEEPSVWPAETQVQGKAKTTASSDTGEVSSLDTITNAVSTNGSAEGLTGEGATNSTESNKISVTNK